MKHIVYTLLAVTAFGFPITHAMAQNLGSGINSAIGTVGGGSISNTDGSVSASGSASGGLNGDVGVSTQTNTRTQTDAQNYYRRDTVTAEENRYGENDIRTCTQHDTHLRVAPQDINPAAGIRENIPPSARVMGRIHGGASYND